MTSQDKVGCWTVTSQDKVGVLDSDITRQGGGVGQ